MKIGPKTRIRLALEAVNREIHNLGQHSNRFAVGPSSEGYAGGYRDALMDVQLALNGVPPSRRNYWESQWKVD